jgi:hypothetical protein
LRKVNKVLNDRVVLGVGNFLRDDQFIEFWGFSAQDLIVEAKAF